MPSSSADFAAWKLSPPRKDRISPACRWRIRRRCGKRSSAGNAPRQHNRGASQADIAPQFARSEPNAQPPLRVGSFGLAPRSLNRIIAYLGLPVAKSCAEVEKVYCSGFSKGFSGNTRDFFRRGQVGDWKNWYQPDHVRLLDQLIGRELQELGFETDSKWADHHQAPPAAT